MITVREIMHPRVARIGPDDSLADLIQLLARERISSVPVVEADCTLIGVVSASDVLAALAEYLEQRPGARASSENAEQDERRNGNETLSEAALSNRRVREILTPVAFTVAPETPVSELATALRQQRIHRALVVDHGRICGIVTAFDLLRAAAS